LRKTAALAKKERLFLNAKSKGDDEEEAAEANV